MTLPTESLARKAVPLASGLLDYFPAALAAVAAVSEKGNQQHSPGQPLHWARSKSGDEADALMRHLLERGTFDADGVRHSAKVAWRALALLQKELEAEEGAPLPRNARPALVPHEVAAAYLRDMAERDDDAPGYNPISPIGAQSGGVVDTTRGPYTPINQQDEE